MPRVHSHYENLRVARNAPPEVIRAAYRALSQRYHPDLNPGDADAARVMSLLNVAYATLSDAVRRQEHDEWLAAMEASAESVQEESMPPTPQSAQSSTQSDSPHRGLWRGQASHLLDVSFLTDYFRPVSRPWQLDFNFIFAHLRTYGVVWLIVIGLVWFYNRSHDVPRASTPAPAAAVQPPTSPSPPTPTYVRPPVAPSGYPWPQTAGYIDGYPVHRAGGLGSVTVDNVQNNTDVFAKLVSLDGPRPHPVRHFYIPAGSQFTVHAIRPGRYDVRFRDLNSGDISRTDPFTLTEIKTPAGFSYDTTTLTLYKVRNGNMQTHSIPETEFE